MERMSFKDLQAHWIEHGKEVNHWYLKLCQGIPIEGLPKQICNWFAHYVPLKGIEQYHYHHDMAKPYCAHWDGNRYHYGPDHSAKSAAMFRLISSCEQTAQLIENDMAFHKARKEDITSVWALPNSEHLYATAWAELYANATAFGGVLSDSFKIKRKRLLWALKYESEAVSPRALSLENSPSKEI